MGKNPAWKDLESISNLAVSVHRNYYQGTPYDQSTGLAAGAFGNPNRYSGGAGEAEVNGTWERPISLFRSTYSMVVESNYNPSSALVGYVWMGPHAAHGTCFVPIPVGVKDVPESYRRARQGVLDRQSAFWAHRYVENLATIKFSYMIKDINATQAQFEEAGVKLRDYYNANFGPDGNISALTADVDGLARSVLQA